MIKNAFKWLKCTSCLVYHDLCTSCSVLPKFKKMRIQIDELANLWARFKWLISYSTKLLIWCKSCYSQSLLNPFSITVPNSSCLSLLRKYKKIPFLLLHILFLVSDTAILAGGIKKINLQLAFCFCWDIVNSNLFWFWRILTSNILSFTSNLHMFALLN